MLSAAVPSGQGTVGRYRVPPRTVAAAGPWAQPQRLMASGHSRVVSVNRLSAPGMLADRIDGSCPDVSRPHTLRECRARRAQRRLRVGRLPPDRRPGRGPGRHPRGQHPGPRRGDRRPARRGPGAAARPAGMRRLRPHLQRGAGARARDVDVRGVRRGGAPSRRRHRGGGDAPADRVQRADPALPRLVCPPRSAAPGGRRGDQRGSVHPAAGRAMAADTDRPDRPGGRR